MFFLPYRDFEDLPSAYAHLLSGGIRSPRVANVTVDVEHLLDDDKNFQMAANNLKILRLGVVIPAGTTITPEHADRLHQLANLPCFQGARVVITCMEEHGLKRCETKDIDCLRSPPTTIEQCDYDLHALGIHLLMTAATSRSLWPLKRVFVNLKIESVALKKIELEHQ